MKAQTFKFKEADEGYKVGAAINARITSVNNKSHYSRADQDVATRVQMCVDTLYSGTVYPATYRKTGVAIKVQKPFAVLDKRMLKAMEADWEARGIVKKDTAQGVTYFIPKSV